MAAAQKITPCLWFDGNAEAAVGFYTSVFADASIDHVHRSTVDYPGGKAGAALLLKFTLAGQHYLALNGGPYHKFNEAISLSVDCEDQAEVDYLWVALTADGGKPVQCGWLKDRYGLSWQIVPRRLPELLSDPDPAKAKRVMQAMMQMVKIDIAKLEAAAEATREAPHQPKAPVLDKVSIEAACRDVLARFMDALNRHDAAGMDAAMHFPHVRHAEGKVTIYPAAGQNPMDLFERLKAKDDWRKSAWTRQTMVQSSTDKAHFLVAYVRYRSDGSEIGAYDSMYTLTNVGGRWGIQMRSSFGP